MQIFNGVFLKVNKTTVNMLQRSETYVNYGYPNLKNIRVLIYMNRKINTQRISLTDNTVIEQVLGSEWNHLYQKLSEGFHESLKIPATLD